MARRSTRRPTYVSACRRKRRPDPAQLPQARTNRKRFDQMRRVVVTGLGIVSSIGNNASEVTESLRQAKSGISFSPDFAEHGFKCQVWGKPNLDPSELVDRRAMRFLSQGGAWNHVAMKQAIADSGLADKDIGGTERPGTI